MLATHDDKTIGAYAAKTRLAELLERVVAGEEITITRHGVPVARLVPIKKKPTADERTAAIKRITKLSRQLTLGGTTIKELISEGRK
jgi:prevent-host-death family protein